MNDTAEGLPPRRRALSATAIGAAIAVTVLDASMVNIALPEAARALGLTPAESVWVVNAYQIAVVGLLIPMSSLGEIMGFRRVWAWGLAGFSLCAALCAAAPSFEWLLLARVAQGACGAAVMALTAGLVRHTYPQSMLGRAIGVNAMTVAACSALGPSTGALVLTLASWPAVFLAHLPIGIGALLLGLRVLPQVPPQPRAFDGAAAALNVLAFGSLFLGLDLLLHRPPAAIPLLALAALALWALVRRELGKPVPMLPLDLLRIREVRLAVCASACMFGSHMATVIALPFHLSGAGMPFWQIGLAMTPYPIALGLLAPFAGRWADRGGASAFACLLGGLLLAAALAALALFRPVGLLPVGALLALAGIGFGFFQSPNNRTMLASAPRARAGGAGGMQATARVLGQSLGAVLTAACFTVSGPALAFAAAAVLAAGGALFSALRR